MNAYVKMRLARAQGLSKGKTGLAWTLPRFWIPLSSPTSDICFVSLSVFTLVVEFGCLVECLSFVFTFSDSDLFYPWVEIVTFSVSLYGPEIRPRLLSPHFKSSRRMSVSLIRSRYICIRQESMAGPRFSMKDVHEGMRFEGLANLEGLTNLALGGGGGWI